MNQARWNRNAAALGAGAMLSLCACSSTSGSAATRHGQSTGNAGTGGAPSSDAAAGAQIPLAADGGAGASSASTGSVDDDAQVGQYVPRAGLDKTAKFSWTESLPGQGTCKAGKYTGTFMCDYKQATPDAGVVASVAGPVSLTLQKSMNGEFLEIADGQLNGVAMNVIGFSSKLSGKLDCTTLKFTAMAVMGVFGFGDPATGVLPVGTFQGSLSGGFDKQTLTLMGDWALSDASGGTCRGPWKASFTP
ncbi:MAG TPA: hypothetical protein VF331_07615 [Polyangiales bacterium]